MIGVIEFLAAHADILELIYDAIVNRGIDRAKVIAAIKREMVEVSDAAMKAELT